MEEWELEHIERNSSKLIKLTRCTTIVKARLKEESLITDEEDEQLNTTGRMYNQFKESSELYQILKTRRGAYEKLIEILQETNQTGALHILKSTELELASITRLAERFLELSVRVSDKVLPTRDAFPDWTIETVISILKNAEIRKEFLKALERKSGLLYLDAKIPEIHNMYIPRSISNRLVLNPMVFTLNCVDVFVFQGIPSYVLAKMVQPYITRSSTKQRSKITCRHIYLDDEEDWDDMVMVCKTPLHLVTKEHNDYVLIRSTEFSDILRENSCDKEKPYESYMLEDHFVDQICAGCNLTGALLCDVPGMGKTCLLQSLAWKLRNKLANSLVFFIDLAWFSTILGNDNTPKNSLEAINILLNITCHSELTIMLQQEYVKATEGTFVLILDGFDEIRDEFNKATTHLLSKANQLSNVQLIISSRPHMRKHLEQTFKLTSYDILPFGRENQVKAIVGHWKEVIPHAIEQKITDYANQCINAARMLRTADQNDILGVPLRCYLLAVATELHVRQLCKPDRSKAFEIDEITTIESIADLYERFIDVLVSKFINSMFEPSEDLRKKLLNYHTYKALRILFPDISMAYCTEFQVEESTTRDYAIKIGLLILRGKNLEFIHRSIAEFFTGKFFAQFCANIKFRTKTFAELITRDLLIDVMCPARLGNETDVLISKGFKTYFDANAYRKEIKKIANKNYTILWFLNNMLERHSVDLETLGQLICNENQQICKDRLLKRACAMIFSFTEKGFTSLISLVSQLIQCLMKDESSHSLQGYVLKSEETAAFLMNHLAIVGSPESSYEVFNLFGTSHENFLLKLCRNYPKRSRSPIRTALETNNGDMAVFFADKMLPDTEWSFLACLTVGELECVSDIDARVMLLQRILGDSDIVLRSLSTMYLKLLQRKFPELPEKINVAVLTKYLLKPWINAKSAVSEYNGFLLEFAFRNSFDEEIIQVLLCLFGKPGIKNHEITYAYHTQHQELGPPLENSSFYTAEAVLSVLDLKDATKAFEELQIDLKTNFELFQNVIMPKTVEILTVLHSDFSSCNKLIYNYIHFFVGLGKAEIVEYLIGAGHDVNQCDIYGNTPLLCTQKEQLLEMTRLLLANGADVNAVNESHENCAHIWFRRSKNVDVSLMIDWTKLIMENSSGDIWRMKDKWQTTPRKCLPFSHGDTHPITMAVEYLLKDHCAEDSDSDDPVYSSDWFVNVSSEDSD